MKLIDSKARVYDQVRVIFDNYTVPASLKEGTRQRRRDKSTGIRSNKVEHLTHIRDKTDSLMLYFAQQLVDTSTVVNTMTAIWESIMTNYESRLTVEASSHEEADTVIILHTGDAAHSGSRVHIYSQMFSSCL